MPQRRRPPHISAAALPVSRLPLGTPTLPSYHSPSNTQTTNSHSSPPRVKSRTSASSSNQEDTRDTTQSSTDSVESLDMAPKHASDIPLPKSIAEAKLERQRKRNEEAEVPLSLDKRKQLARGKGKQWKPFDFTADTPKDLPSHEGGISVNEVRVNTFRALSRNTSSVRSASAMSQSTNETGPSDMERQDSALTDQGFQVFTGRKNKKHVDELNTYESRMQERQTTVEATFDKREIYEVFGNALPGPEYIAETIGNRNGQIQFIQHPNGDVSAQQWSSERYMWENIGHFSNIRKKIEGQLASDRLKGETTSQTLQQNTLSYFKTVAKQREAHAMGVPFGPKEIQANMPHQPRPELAAASTGLRESTKDAPAPQQLGTLFVKEDQTAEDPTTKKVTSILKPSGEPFLPQSLRPRQDSDLVLPRTSQESSAGRYDDPFYTRSTFQQIYGGNNYMQQYSNPSSKTLPQSGPSFGSVPQQAGLNYNFHFPPNGAGDGRATLSNAYSLAAGLADIAARPEMNWYPNTEKHLPTSVGQRTSQRPMMDLTSQTSFNNTSGRYGTPATEIAAPQPKPAVPFSNRASMSDQLWKITETAKERQLSQSNISRTVLYDPYQNQQHMTKVDLRKEPEKRDGASSDLTFQDNISGKRLQPPTLFNPTSANFFPTVLAPATSQDGAKPASPVGGTIENNLQESSPDTQWSKKPCNHTTASINTPGDAAATPQDFRGPFFTATESSHGSSTNTTSTNGPKQTYDEELNDWWTSGNKFARQQDFFDSIMASNKAGSNSTAANSPPAHLTPIGPPSRNPQKQDSSPFNPTTTRLLIPVLENLASYVQGPPEKRRDYFCQWSKAPEWCIDRSEGGNNSFFDKDWGRPPARVGRDPRYQNRGSWSVEHTSPAASRYGPAGVRSGGGFSGSIDRRFNFGGRY